MGGWIRRWGLKTDPRGMIHISLSFDGVNEKATLLNSSAGVINDTVPTPRSTSISASPSKALQYCDCGYEGEGLTIDDVQFPLRRLVQDPRSGQDVPGSAEDDDLDDGFEHGDQEDLDWEQRPS